MVYNQSALCFYDNSGIIKNGANKTINEGFKDLSLNRFVLDSLNSWDFTNNRLRGPHCFIINGAKIMVRDQSTEELILRVGAAMGLTTWVGKKVSIGKR